MKRRRVLLLSMVAVPLVGAAVVVLMLRHEPRFYRQAEVEPGPHRQQLSRACSKSFSGIVNQAIDPHGEWSYSFTANQLNSFFEEGFRDLEGKSLEKLNIGHPRVVFEDDRLRLAFRYGSGWWSTVLSYDLKIWVAAKDTNVLVVEVQGRNAGAMPMPTHHILNELSDLGRKHNIEVNWFRNEQNHPVALVRFNSDRPRPATQLTGLKIRDGQLTIQGQAVQAPQQGAFEIRARPIVSPIAD